MQASAIIEVAIGLVVTWLVISLATSQLQEFLVELFSWRSIFLKNQIRNMLHGAEGSWIEGDRSELAEVPGAKATSGLAT